MSDNNDAADEHIQKRRRVSDMHTSTSAASTTSNAASTSQSAHSTSATSMTSASTATSHIDEDLHSRQLAVYGRQAMGKLSATKVLVRLTDFPEIFFFFSFFFFFFFFFFFVSHQSQCFRLFVFIDQWIEWSWR
jgi:hypothetical protein